MRTLLVILLLLVCGCAKSQLSQDQRKVISHELRLQIDTTWKKIKYYDYMMGLWARDRDLGLIERYSPMDTMRVVRDLHIRWSKLMDSLTTVEEMKNPDGTYKKNPDGSYGWPWPSPFEAKTRDQHKPSPANPDSVPPPRERPPIIGT